MRRGYPLVLAGSRNFEPIERTIMVNLVDGLRRARARSPPRSLSTSTLGIAVEQLGLVRAEERRYLRLQPPKKG